MTRLKLNCCLVTESKEEYVGLEVRAYTCYSCCFPSIFIISPSLKLSFTIYDIILSNKTKQEVCLRDFCQKFH